MTKLFFSLKYAFAYIRLHEDTFVSLTQVIRPSGRVVYYAVFSEHHMS